MLADLNNADLVPNVLNARDHAPLVFTWLQSYAGSLSLQGQVGGSQTFTEGTALALSPQINGTSSPSFTVSALTGAGPALVLMQPISPSFVANKWNAHDHELLLSLFVKTIQLPPAINRNKACDLPIDKKISPTWIRVYSRSRFCCETTRRTRSGIRTSP